MDLILGGFVTRNLEGFTDAEIADLERIMDIPDQDMLSWATKQEPVPPEHASAASRPHSRPHAMIDIAKLKPRLAQPGRTAVSGVPQGLDAMLLPRDREGRGQARHRPCGGR